MNFQISQTTESPTTLINQTFESTTIATKDPLPSGTGPCRSCHESISPDAKGQLRAIYSKTGELSGQWHRNVSNVVIMKVMLQTALNVIFNSINMSNVMFLMINHIVSNIIIF